MSGPVRALTAMAQVASVPSSMAFYRRLGFEVENTFTPNGETDPSWASLVSDRARLMLARGDGPASAGASGVLFYIYCDDVPAFRESLVADGMDAGPIENPFYAPRGEFCLKDPDGYVLMISHT
jgi:hypothetical protein